MSQLGVRKAVKLFETMQNLREELMRMGTASNIVHTPEAKQDILLSHMVDSGKDAMKDRFMELISPPPKSKTKPR
jgi:hypothetical protein